MTPETQPRTEQVSDAEVRAYAQGKSIGGLCREVLTLQRRLADAERQNERLRDQTFPKTWAGFKAFIDEVYPDDIFPDDDRNLGPQFVVAARRLAIAEAKLAKVRELCDDWFFNPEAEHLGVVSYKGSGERFLVILIDDVRAALGESVGGDQPAEQQPDELQAAVETALRWEQRANELDGLLTAATQKLRQWNDLFRGGPDTSCRTVWENGIECISVPIADIRALAAGGGTPEPPAIGERAADALADLVIADAKLRGTQPEPQRCAHCNETIFMSRVGWLHGEPPRGTEFCRFPKRNSQVMNPRATPAAAPLEGEPT